MRLPTAVLSLVDNVAGNYVTTVFAPIAAKVSTPLWTAVTLYVAIYGYMVMVGHIQQLYKTAFRNIFVIGFVTYTAVNWDWFSYLYDAITQTPDMFASTVSLGKDHNSVLDELFDRGMDTAFSIWRKSGSFEIVMPILGAIVFGVTLWLIGSAVFLLALAKFLVAVTLALGPIFISFYLFSTTRQWFKNWIGSLVGLVIFQILVFAALGLGYSVYESIVPAGDLYTANSLDKDQIQGGILPLLLIFVTLVFVLGRTDQRAQSLIGSMGYVSDAASAVYNKARGAMSSAGRRGPSVGGTARGMMNAGKWAKNKFGKNKD